MVHSSASADAATLLPRYPANALTARFTSSCQCRTSPSRPCFIRWAMTTVAGLRCSASSTESAALPGCTGSVRVLVGLLSPRLVRHLAKVGTELADLDAALG